MCRVLGVSRSGYYSFCAGVATGGSTRDQANRRLLQEIRIIHTEVDRIYGAPRVYTALREKGIICSRHRVERVMASNSIRAKTVPRCKRVTTHSKAEERALRPDLLRRNFVTTRAHAVWMGDVTCLSTREGWLYLAVVLDLYSRAVVGWATSRRLNTHLVTEALTRAFTSCHSLPASAVIFHSDRGTTYTSGRFEDLLRKRTVIHSYAYTCYDNAVVESFFHTLKTECTQFHVYQTRQQAQASLFHYIEVFYNRRRLHSSLRYRSPEAVLRQQQLKAT